MAPQIGVKTCLNTHFWGNISKFWCIPCKNGNLWVLNWRNNRNFDYFSPKLRYFNTGMVVLIDFIRISIKSTRNILIIPTNTSKIEPIKAGFSTNDRFQNTAINRSGIYGSYTVGNWGCSILWQLYLPIGFAWPCERW